MIFAKRLSTIPLIFRCLVMLLVSCHNAPENNLPVTSASAASSSTVIPIPNAPAAGGPAWHWINPQPQGNALWVALASASCGVVALGEESTIMRSTDDGVTWTIRQLPDRWRFKAAALSGTDVIVLGDTSDNNVIIDLPNCGSGEAKIIKTLDSKTDGAANGVAADASGHVYVSTVTHARGRMLCSKDKTFNLSVCDDQPGIPFYGVFADKNGRIFVAGGYQGTAGGLVRGSTDQGATWKTLSQHLGTIAYGIWGDPEGKHLVATGSGEIYTSADGGVTWRASPALSMSGGSMELGTGDAPYVPNDFASWVFGNPETASVLITSGGTTRGSIATSPSKFESLDVGGFDAAVATGNGHWVGVGGSGLVKRSIDDGKTWTTISKDILTEGEAFVDVRANDKSVFVLRKTRFLRSDDNGKSFVVLANVDVPELPISPRDFMSFAVDASVVLMPRPSAKSIGLSTDRGATFSEIPIHLEAAQNVSHVWSGSPKQFFASGKSGALFRSADGATFTALDLKSHDDLAAGYARDHEIVLTGTSAAATGHVFHSLDDGKTWTTTPLDLEPYGVAVLGADIFVAGRYGKIAHSKDSGKTWAMAIDLDCGDVTGLVAQNARIDLICGEGHLFTSIDRAATFQKTPVAADVELLFSDGSTGLLAASSRGFPQLLHFY